MGYPIEPFEWGLAVWAAFEQFKIDCYFVDFGQVKINPTCLILLILGKMLGRKKQSKPSLSDKKIQEPNIESDTSDFQWFNQQECKNWLGSPVNK